MITNNEAAVIAVRYLEGVEKESGAAVQLTKTREESFGWVFFYQSKEFLETGALNSMLAGNAPFVVDRRDGAVHVLGTVYPVDVYLKEYPRLQA